MSENRITSRMYEAVKTLTVKNRRAIVTVNHLIEVAVANYFAFFLRFEGILSPATVTQFKVFLPVLLTIRLGLYLYFGLNKDLWRYSSIGDLVKIVKSASLGTVIFVIAVRYLFGDSSYPRSIYVIDWLLLVILSGGSRLFIRVFREYAKSEISRKRALIIGAGDAGEMIVRDMKTNPSYSYEPIGFIDDNPSKKGLSIHGIPIFGPRTMIREVIEKHAPEEILISMPTASHKTINEIYEICKPFNVPIQILPGLSDIIEGNVSVSQIKPLSLEDLLQREPVRTAVRTVRDYIQGKSVLVTGAGGSIGSELCRQILEYGPSNLIMFDRYENGLFEIDMELQAKGKERSGTRSEVRGDNPSPGTRHQVSAITTVVGDMRDRAGLEYQFSRFKPQIIFHAASHKHVPLMELNPMEAVKNNVFGARNLVEAASRHKAESFVMVSTDKAVNPTSIMGGTKRITEFLAISMNETSETRFTAVRFGNVLGSNGSVVQIFKEQVRRGGPLTVTHPDIKRFFMLIPEAVYLVLIAAAGGRGGDIIVLDMGEQIKILDMAENLIRLSGFIPYEDIKIEFTGLRPGEKLYEELFDESETMVPAFHEKLKIAIPSNVPSPGHPPDAYEEPGSYHRRKLPRRPYPRNPKDRAEFQKELDGETGDQQSQRISMSLNEPQLAIEEQLLLLLSRVGPSSEALDAAGEILAARGHPVDFSNLVRLAGMNGVSPLLYRNAATLKGIPEKTLDALKDAYLATFSRNVHHSRGTMRIFSLLRQAGVVSVPLKGSLFSDMALGDIGLYPTGDIDFLVRPSDLERTKKTLADAGYQESITAREADLVESSYHLIFHNDAYSVEMHWNLVQWFFETSPDFWWEETLTTRYGDTELTLLSPERYMLYGIFHLFTHRFRPLKWFLVISGLADKYRAEMDWDKLLSCAEKLRMKRLTLFTLKLAHDLLGADIPDHLAYRRIAGYSLLKKVILSGLFQEMTRSYVRLALFTTLLDTPVDMVAVLLRRIFPPASEIRLRYGLSAGSKKVPLYYLLNPLLMVIRKRG